MSPPSRGAWIEISIKIAERSGKLSRPPRGGRGLKSHQAQYLNKNWESPPSRGAWIEIVACLVYFGYRVVAPLAGGVD